MVDADGGGARGGGGGRMRWTREIQLDLFGPVKETEPAPPASWVVEPDSPVLADDPEPVVELLGQLGLFSSRSARLAPVRRLLAAGAFGGAAEAAAGTRGEAALAKALRGLSERVAATRSPEDLARADLGAELARIGAVAPGDVVAAARRGVTASVARRCEALGPDGTVAGRLAPEWWEAAGYPEEAEQSAHRSLEREPAAPRTLLWLANHRYGEGEAFAARDVYRRAVAAPGAVQPGKLADARVAALILDARDLELDPPGPWLVLLGILAELWSLHPVPARPPNPADRFHEALVRSREATARGQRDIAARREMKSLAPQLFAEFLSRGQI